MLEKYFVRPETADHIRRSWIADAVEGYVTWHSAQRYSKSTVERRVPVAMAFGDSAKDHGATELRQLPGHVESFAQVYAASHGRRLRGCPSCPDRLSAIAGMRRYASPNSISRQLNEK